MRPPLRSLRNGMTVAASAACLTFISLAAAQAPGAAPTGDGSSAPAAGGVVIENDPKFGTGEPAQKLAETQATDFMKSRNIKSGYLAKPKIFVAVGTSDLSMACGTPGYELHRSIGFQKAMLDAKERLAEWLGVNVSNELKRALNGQNEPADQDSDKGLGQPPKGLVEKAKLILDDELDRELQKRGKGDAKPDKSAEDAAKERKAKALKILGTDEFKSVTKLLAQAELAGLQAYRCFESSGAKPQVAVIAVYSQSTDQLAKSLLTGAPAPTGVKQQPVQEWADALSDTELLYSHGAQIRTDETGEVVLVAFGTSTPQNPKSGAARNVAKKDARAAALNEARRFIGTMLVLDTLAERGESIKFYSEGEDDVKNTSKFDQKVQESSKSLTLHPEPIRDWHLQHPCEKDGCETYGCLVKFSLSGARDAGELAAALKAIGGWKGGEGPKFKPEASPPAPKPTKRPGGSSNGAGAEGELDPGAAGRGGPGARGLD